MSHNRFGNFLTIPAHISYWIIGATVVGSLLSDWTGYDLSHVLPMDYYQKVQSYSKIASGVLILSLLTVILRLFLNRRSEHTRWRHVFEELHVALDAISIFRDEIAHKTSNVSNWDREDTDNFKKFAVLKYQDLATKICNLFCAYTGHECHVSFKTLDANGEVSTVARDQRGGSAERGRVDEHLVSFPYARNTAFRDILDSRKMDSYISNHLRLRALCRFYENANEDWRKHYAAVAVAPITTTGHAAKINRTTVFGFLCVDNRGGGFDKGVCRELLTHVARHLHQVTVLLGQVHVAERSELTNKGGIANESAGPNGQGAKQGELR
ncbi:MULTISPECIES: hypothetical protein [unclassified Bradyrhizobium]|uniref:hypothetical protein n=1 Tax=unclassified Bradyrhizobium TaxID=2631580 RepID=UPI002915E016|nr:MULTISPECIES: hypothetical protein [unclassified Bradyrhizobium]